MTHPGNIGPEWDNGYWANSGQWNRNLQHQDWDTDYKHTWERKHDLAHFQKVGRFPLVIWHWVIMKWSLCLPGTNMHKSTPKRVLARKTWHWMLLKALQLQRKHQWHTCMWSNSGNTWLETSPGSDRKPMDWGNAKATSQGTRSLATVSHFTLHKCFRHCTDLHAELNYALRHSISPSACSYYCKISCPDFVALVKLYVVVLNLSLHI